MSWTIDVMRDIPAIASLPCRQGTLGDRMHQKSTGLQWVQGPLNRSHSKPGWAAGNARTSSYRPMWEMLVSTDTVRVHQRGAVMALCRFGLEKDTRGNATAKPSWVLAEAAIQAHDDAPGRPRTDALVP